MIVEILKVMFFTYVWVMGVKISTAEGMIFEKLGNWGEKKDEQGYTIFKALISCAWCLPSFHSLIGWAFSFLLGAIPFQWDWRYLVMWPIVIMGTSLCTGLTWLIYLTINTIRENNENQTSYYKHMEEEAYFDLKDRKAKYKKKDNNS